MPTAACKYRSIFENGRHVTLYCTRLHLHRLSHSPRRPSTFKCRTKLRFGKLDSNHNFFLVTVYPINLRLTIVLPDNPISYELCWVGRIPRRGFVRNCVVTRYTVAYIYSTQVENTRFESGKQPPKIDAQTGGTEKRPLIHPESSLPHRSPSLLAIASLKMSTGVVPVSIWLKGPRTERDQHIRGNGREGEEGEDFSVERRSALSVPLSFVRSFKKRRLVFHACTHPTHLYSRALWRCVAARRALAYLKSPLLVYHSPRHPTYLYTWRAACTEDTRVIK